MNNLIIVGVAMSLLSCSKKEMPLTNKPNTDTATTSLYTESTEDIANRERGFFRYAEVHSSNYVPLDESTLAGYRMSQGIFDILERSLTIVSPYELCLASCKRSQRCH